MPDESLDESTGARIYKFPPLLPDLSTGERKGAEWDRWMDCPACGEEIMMGDTCVYCGWAGRLPGEER